MSKIHKTSLFAVAGLIVLTTFALFAQWVDNGAPVCTAADEQSHIEVASDGAGGAIITWTDDRGTYEDIYVQRVDPHGDMVWTTDGIYVTSLSAQQHMPKILSNGAGGAIIAWTDHRNVEGADIYAQMIDAGGIFQWPPTDVALSSSSTETDVVRGMVSNGAGGAIIVWDGKDSSNPIDYNIYAQHVDAGGNVQWAAAGVTVCSLSYDQRFPRITADGSGGAIITWQDGRNGVDANIYAQRLDATGAKLWAADGVVICSESHYQNSPYITQDGAGGAIITWQDLRGVDQDIYAQRVDGDGNVLWTTDGIAVCSASGDQSWHVMTGDGAGGALVTWWDYRNGNYDIYAQRIDTTGTLLWVSDGLPVCTQTDHQMGPAIAPDGAGGAIISWGGDYREGSEDIYAQWIDAAGNAQWPLDGVAICTAEDDQWNPEMVADGAGGAIIAWNDVRNGNQDIFAQKINKNGVVGYYPCPYIISASDVPNDQGGKLSLLWEGSIADTLPNTEITHYSVWRRLPVMEVSATGGALEFFSRELDIPVDFDGQAVRHIPLESEYAWEWLSNIPARHFEAYAYTVESLYDSIETNTGWQYFMVSAHTESPVIYFDSPVDSGYSVDNIAPGVPQDLIVSYNTGTGNYLSWNPSPEPDFQCYRVYRGDTEDFIPAPGNLVHETATESWSDPEYDGWDVHYKITALDYVGNESDVASPVSITGDDIPSVPKVFSLYQNVPNPFNPSTMIRFDLPKASHVKLSVFNAKGELVSTIADRQMSEGSKELIWTGVDGRGRSVSSGVYFYRLVAGDFVQTRKMILLR